jgi:cytochrome b pre-mRNA-processing protein 3
VPDSIDGRFGLIVVHLFLLQHRLVEGNVPAHQQFARFLSEAFFNDMDDSLRELGVADTGVSHRIKKMGKAYHGSLQAYTAGLSDRQAMRAALARNLYGTVTEGDVAALDRMAHYIETMHTSLHNVDISVILAGSYAWPDAASLAV